MSPRTSDRSEGEGEGRSWVTTTEVVDSQRKDKGGWSVGRVTGGKMKEKRRKHKGDKDGALRAAMVCQTARTSL
jgi:hypothetical protein